RSGTSASPAATPRSPASSASRPATSCSCPTWSRNWTPRARPACAPCCWTAARTIRSPVPRPNATAIRASGPSPRWTRTCRSGASAATGKQLAAMAAPTVAARAPLLHSVGQAVAGAGALFAAPAVLVADLDGVFADREVGRQRAAPQVVRRFRLWRAVPAPQFGGQVVAHVLHHQARIGLQHLAHRTPRALVHA